MKLPWYIKAVKKPYTDNKGHIFQDFKISKFWIFCQTLKYLFLGLFYIIFKNNENDKE